MKVVFVQQFGTAIVQHLRVDDAASQRGLKPSSSCARCIKRCGLISVPKLAIFAHVKAGEGKDHIEFVAPPCERRSVAGVVHWVRRTVDEHDEMVAEMMLVLRTSQRIEQPL